ncbi:hypothetical protein M5D96_009262 [Drosophila gunungcola]|nr:hypothetical protein M5D96_009262 [Drosophila gunungcola]
MSSATEANVLLLRAVEKQAPLYDRYDERYRKRLPSENSWDMVAAEVGEPVEKCKRRWRQLRNDYTRWCNADANRRRSGQRRLSYPLADELRFLDRHLNLNEDVAIEDERSVSSDKDRDSNRDSESRDHLQQQPQASLKKDATLAKKPVRQGKPISKLTEEVETSEINGDKDQTEKGSPKQELDEAEEPEKVPELDSFLQSDNEGDECEDEEHLEQLEGFDFDLEQSIQEQESSPDKSLATDNADSPASQSEFFIKQSNDPHLLIIGKKNSSSASVGEPEGEDSNSGDPLEEEDGEAMEDSADESVGAGESRSAASDTAISPSGRLRRLRRAVRSSLSSAGIKDLPIQKPGLGQRITRLQRRKSMSLAAVHSVRSATSPVKMTPVPRSQPINKPPSGQVQIKKVNPRDDIFPRPKPPADSQTQNQNQNQNQTKTPRPSTPAGSQNQNQKQNQTKTQHLIYPKSDAVIAIPQVPAPPPQRRSVGRPPKKIQFIQRMVGPQPRPQSPVPTKVLTISKPSSAPVNGGSSGSNTANKSTSSASTMTKVSNTLKSPENITVMSYSPSSTNTTSSAKATSSPSGTVVTAVPTTSTAGSSITVPPYLTLLKRVERGSQTDSPSIFSD